MSTGRYIIREAGVGYSDEVYYDVGFKIHDVYDDKKKAENDLRKLQLDRVKQIPLAETSSLFDGEASLLQAVEKFIKEKTGESVLKGGDYLDYGTDMPKGLSDDDWLTLGKMIDTLGFDLVELSGTQMLYVLWDPAEDEPNKIYEESGEFLIYSQTEDDLIEQAEETLNYSMEDSFTGEGTYEDLSDSPELLKSLVESSKALSYNKDNSSIEIADELNAATLKSLNGLLKTPFFSIKKMSTQQIMKLENEMDEY